MKKKGFTLVELLAVIVILAIIALIATPTILSMIENSRKGAAESSLLSYVDQMEKQIVTKSMNATTAVDYNGTYTVKGATAEKSDATLNLDIKGDQPNNPGEDIIVVSNGNVTSAKLKFGTYYVAYGYNTSTKDVVYCSSREGYPEKCEDKTIPTPDTYKVYSNGTAIYFDPETNTVCTNYQASNSLNENKSGCMRWYAFNDSDTSSTVNLILDHNTTGSVAWNSKETNTKMQEVQTALYNNTSTWKTTARLITADEIADITDHPSFNSATSTKDNYFYFENNSTTIPTLEQGERRYKWLYDYIGTSDPDYNTEGYWTSSPVASNTELAWYVAGVGILSSNEVYYTDYGVRPVITISKTLLS